MPLSALKKGRYFSADLARNRERAAIRPVSFWTSFMVRGGFKSSVALIFCFYARMLESESSIAGHGLVN